MTKKLETAVFGGGCFWCTEAVFKMLRGVVSVLPGYAGSEKSNTKSLTTDAAPTYEEVCSGNTGYAEVIKIEFEPEKISYEDLLTVFFASHDPTTLNRQDNDTGTQYRSIILFTNDWQEQTAKRFIADLNASSHEGKPITTEIKPLTQFFPAESYHVDYYAQNKEAQYCELVINPKLEKVQKKFAHLLEQRN